jgi:hypothetical protein
VGCPSWWEDGSVICTFCWSLPVQSFLGLSFVHFAGPCQCSLSWVWVPWDWRPYFTISDLRLIFLSLPMTHRVMVEVFDPASTWVLMLNQSHIATDSQSVSKSWCRAPSGAYDQIFITVWQLRSRFLWCALSDERTGLSFVHAADPCQRSLSRFRVPWDSRPYFTVSDLRHKGHLGDPGVDGRWYWNGFKEVGGEDVDWIFLT